MMTIFFVFFFFLFLDRFLFVLKNLKRFWFGFSFQLPLGMTPRCRWWAGFTPESCPPGSQRRHDL